MRRVMPRIFGLLFLVLLLVSPMPGADEAVLGAWEAVSEDTPLGNLSWIVTITKEADKLGGSANCLDLGTYDLSDVKVEGNAFTFTFYPSGRHVVVKAKLEGDKFTGTWELDGVPGGAYNGKKKKQGD